MYHFNVNIRTLSGRYVLQLNKLLNKTKSKKKTTLFQAIPDTERKVAKPSNNISMSCILSPSCCIRLLDSPVHVFVEYSDPKTTLFETPQNRGPRND